MFRLKGSVCELDTCTWGEGIRTGKLGSLTGPCDFISLRHKLPHSHLVTKLWFGSTNSLVPPSLALSIAAAAVSKSSMYGLCRAVLSDHMPPDKEIPYQSAGHAQVGGIISSNRFAFRKRTLRADCRESKPPEMLRSTRICVCTLNE